MTAPPEHIERVTAAIKADLGRQLNAVPLHNDVNSRHNDVNSRHNDVNSRHNDVNSRHNDVNSSDWTAVGDVGSVDLESLALAAYRATLESIMEPSEEMEIAGVSATMTPRDIWQAMLRQLIKEADDG